MWLNTDINVFIKRLQTFFFYFCHIFYIYDSLCRHVCGRHSNCRGSSVPTALDEASSLTMAGTVSRPAGQRAIHQPQADGHPSSCISPSSYALRDGAAVTSRLRSASTYRQVFIFSFITHIKCF